VGCVTNSHLAADAKTSVSGGVTRMESPSGGFSVEVTGSGVFLQGPSRLVHMSFDEMRINANNDIFILSSDDMTLDAENEVAVVTDGDLVIHSDLDIGMSSGLSLLLEVGFDADVKTNHSIWKESGLELDIKAGTSVTVDGSTKLNLDGDVVGLNGTCSGVVSVGDQLIAPPPVGIGTVIIGSLMVFTC